MANKVPYAEKTERYVLSAIIRNDKMLEYATSSGISEDSFFNVIHKRIWNEMVKLNANGTPIDLVELAQALPGDMVYIAELDGSIATSTNFTTWLDGLREFQARRKLFNAVSEAEKMIAKKSSSADVVAMLENETIQAKQIAADTTAKSFDEVAGELMDRLCNPQKIIRLFPKGTEAGCDIQLHDGELMVIGARSGSGKTAIAAQMTYSVLQSGGAVLYVCTESSAADIMARIVAAASGVSHYKALNGKLNDEDKKRYALSFNELRNVYRDKISILGCDGALITADSIKTELRRFRLKNGRVDLVVVDFIQGVSQRKGHSYRSKIEAIDDTIMTLHDTFIEEKAAGIVLSQFNRSGQNIGGDSMPDTTWLKDTSSLEQLAHTVAFLWRKNQDDPITRFYSRKTRNQSPFQLELTWNGVSYNSKQIYQPAGGYNGR